MKEIRETETYSKWFSKLADSRAKYRILVRVKRLASGNPGAGRFLGEIYEMKIAYGPGYRVYYKESCFAAGMSLRGAELRGILNAALV